MSHASRISRVTSDAFNREINTIVTANALGKIFTGKEVLNLDLNSTTKPGIYRFNETCMNAPMDVESGYVYVTAINPDHIQESKGRVRIRQIVYPDSTANAFTRVGNAASTMVEIRWSEWVELGNGGMFVNFEELTRDQMAEPKTMYRSFNTFILTLPDVNEFAEGTYFGLEQYDALGIIIDTNGAEIRNGRLLYDPISELWFEMVVSSNGTYWTLSKQDVSSLDINDYRPTTEKIEYVEPQEDNGISTCTKFIACVTRDKDDNPVWVVDSENSVATIIKSLFSAFVNLQNEMYSYVDAQDTPYRLFRKVEGNNIVAKPATFYRTYGTNVITLPDPTKDVEGRWVGIEQQPLSNEAMYDSTTYIVDSHIGNNSTTRKVFDPESGQMFELIVNADSYKWILVEDLPSDYNTNPEYLDSSVKVRTVSSTPESPISLREMYISRDNSGSLRWVIAKPMTMEML